MVTWTVVPDSMRESEKKAAVKAILEGKTIFVTGDLKDIKYLRTNWHLRGKVRTKRRTINNAPGWIVHLK